MKKIVPASRVLSAIMAMLFLITIVMAQGGEKPRMTLDEFFDFVSIDNVAISPDGGSVVIATDRADFERHRFRKDLWLYRDGSESANGAGSSGSSGSLIPLTQTGHDSDPRWSPDGQWIAFISDRKNPQATAPEEPGSDSASDSDTGANPGEENQLYVIAVHGGEAVALTSGREEVHTFTWSADSQSLYFATRIPWTKQQEEAHKKEWKDAKRYRESERGDRIYKVALAAANTGIATGAAQPGDLNQPDDGGTPGARRIAETPLRVRELAASPDGKTLAFATDSPSQRFERISDYEIYLLDSVAKPSAAPQQITHNEAQEENLRWTPDSRHIFFDVLSAGSVEGTYKDEQGRVYWLDPATGAIERWAKNFPGSLGAPVVTPNGALLNDANVGTARQVYIEISPGAALEKLPDWPGTYEYLSAAEHGPQVAFVYSSLSQPAEVYLAESIEKLRQAKPITSFNKLFTQRDLPQGKPYRWKADDHTTVEGMLIYPPGKFEAKHLRMLTLIHGGPADADGDAFKADWYSWGGLAASDGWLVFQPNYRGSTGYGNKFFEQIVPPIVSRPGKDILAGVDALVRDGIADPQRLAIGGYSYGGYMTNWLITQTTRFKAAVSGAGAVEHAANWGNDDESLDDAFFLGGLPWQAEENYNREAALWQFDKVRTPTHIVAGADDIRVAALEQYVLEHALRAVGVPTTLLIFPGEGHPLDKDPWHGKIKVREELKWLEKYVGGSAAD